MANATLREIESLAMASGSDWMYSRLFLPRDQQPAFNAMLALRTEVGAQVARVSEPAVAEAKLEWWRAEIQRVAEGRGVHPLASGIVTTCTAHGIAVEYLLELVDAIDMRMLPGRLLSAADEKLFRYRHDGVLAEQASLLAGHDSRQELELARALGELRSHVDALRTLARQLAQGNPLFADASLDAAAVDRHAPTSEQLERFLTVQWQRWDHLRVAARTLLQETNPAAALAVQWALLEDDYRRMQRQRDQLPNREPRLAGPLRRLFIAWRAARRSRRRARR
ncbi:MAG: squalene/phytoene synthase family protein [Gammaproteobacteria bacterium]|nr:squalene/phytoene synthase family protein [Gammaproteobacteria bacterium]